jgi:hypothetical protein
VLEAPSRLIAFDCISKIRYPFVVVDRSAFSLRKGSEILTKLAVSQETTCFFCQLCGKLNLNKLFTTPLSFFSPLSSSFRFFYSSLLLPLSFLITQSRSRYN